MPSKLSLLAKIPAQCFLSLLTFNLYGIEFFDLQQTLKNPNPELVEGRGKLRFILLNNGSTSSP